MDVACDGGSTTVLLNQYFVDGSRQYEADMRCRDGRDKEDESGEKDASASYCSFFYERWE